MTINDAFFNDLDASACYSDGAINPSQILIPQIDADALDEYARSIRKAGKDIGTDGNDIGNLDPTDEQKIFMEMGGEILAYAPEIWTRLIYEHKTVNGFGSDGLTAEYPDGTSELIDRPVSLLTHAKKLRYGMYRDGKGTWFTLKYTITYPTSYTVDFNYDDKPKFVFPPDSISYAEDLKQFPRSPENIPAWLQEELRKAEAEQG